MRKIFIFSAVATMMASLFGCGQAAKNVASNENKTSLDQPEWSRNAVIYEVNWRQMTDEGNLEALEKQLPRLRELGVDILWLMPVHPISEMNRKGELGSYYAVRDYKAVNPELGTLEQFRHFVDKAHEAGFKVIIDWVPNHTGCDNPWVEAHPEYYALNDSGKMFGPYDWTDVYKLDYSNPETRKAMTDALSFWVTQMDIDGFRCDVAGEVPTDYWDEARPVLDSLKTGGVFMLAEASKPELQKNAFNMGYNWPMKDVFNAIAATSGQNTYNDHVYPVVNALAIDSLLAEQATTYPGDTYLMNMITNHDLNSWEGTEFQRLGNLTDAFAILSYTLPGMPLIYTGQETGMNRAFEFFTKDKAPEFEPRNEYFTFYQKLNDLKHGQKALAAGNAGGEMVRYMTSSPNIYAFSRSVDDSTVTVIVNLGKDSETVEFTSTVPENGENNINYFTGQHEDLPTAMGAGEYRVYITKANEILDK